jgi:prepilin-type N-terminal cleavage/methylation domain-containing protein
MTSDAGFTLVELPATSRRGFTLVELLVVITIIVVLLALLTPALDRAMYQAELTVCAARLKGIGSAVAGYAMENRRFYPDRGLHDRTDQSQALWIAVYTLANPSEGYDMRPGLRGVLSPNKMLQCPLVQPVDLEQETIGGVLTSYNPWWGWKYHPASGAQPGMFKLGDRFGWDTRQYSTLAGDIDMFYRQAPAIQGSHPDSDPQTLTPLHVQEPPPGQVGDPNRADPLLTVSRWTVNSSTVNNRRGPIDMNHLFDDLSVERYASVQGWNPTDERMDEVPVFMHVPRNDTTQIPRR